MKGEPSIHTWTASLPFLRLARALGCSLAALSFLALPAAAQDEAPVEPTRADLSAADEAARAFDYQKAIEELEKAQPDADAGQKPLIKRRLALYERYLGMSWLIEQASDRPAKLVGQGMTRGGKQLLGLIQLLELGVTPTARIGNRLLNQGSLALRVGGNGTRVIPAREAAQISITWSPPKPDDWPNYWFIEKIRVMLQTGEVVEGAPTWVLPISSVSVREPGAEEDLTVNAFPALGKELEPKDLIAELLIIGAPPVKKPAAAPPATESPPPPAAHTPPPLEETP